jgi:hypothetical protein
MACSSRSATYKGLPCLGLKPLPSTSAHSQLCAPSHPSLHATSPGSPQQHWHLVPHALQGPPYPRYTRSSSTGVHSRLVGVRDGCKAVPALLSNALQPVILPASNSTKCGSEGGGGGSGVIIGQLEEVDDLGSNVCCYMSHGVDATACAAYGARHTALHNTHTSSS